jgi:hypothetical protein
MREIKADLMYGTFIFWEKALQASPHPNSQSRIQSFRGLYLFVYFLWLFFKVLTNRAGNHNEIIFEVPNNKYVRFLDEWKEVLENVSFLSKDALSIDVKPYPLYDLGLLRYFLIMVYRYPSCRTVVFPGFLLKAYAGSVISKNTKKLITFDGLSAFAIGYHCFGGHVYSYRPTTTFDTLEVKFLSYSTILVKSVREISNYLGDDIRNIGMSFAYINNCSLGLSEKVLVVDTVPNDYVDIDTIRKLLINIFEATKTKNVHVKLHPGATETHRTWLQHTARTRGYKVKIVDDVNLRYAKCISFESSIALDLIWQGNTVAILGSELTNFPFCDHFGLSIPHLQSEAEIINYLCSESVSVTNILSKIILYLQPDRFKDNLKLHF